MDLDGRDYKVEFLAFARFCFECTLLLLLFTFCLLAPLPAEQLQYFSLCFFFLTLESIDGASQGHYLQCSNKHLLLLQEF